MIQRLTEWPEALAAALALAQNKPFAWGENDCCLFAANCAEAITGVDLANGFRGYQDRAQALEMIAGFGGLLGFASHIAKIYSLPEMKPLQARRGDICLFEGGNGPTLGICAGDKLLAPGKSGLIGYAITKGLYAWGVG